MVATTGERQKKLECEGVRKYFECIYNISVPQK